MMLAVHDGIYRSFPKLVLVYQFISPCLLCLLPNEQLKEKQSIVHKEMGLGHEQNLR